MTKSQIWKDRKARRQLVSAQAITTQNTTAAPPENLV
jgi:hypothetical protein